MSAEPQCEGCGKRPEVYGSSWCAGCHEFLPRYTKERIIKMREALWKVAYRQKRVVELQQIAHEALQA